MGDRFEVPGVLRDAIAVVQDEQGLQASKALAHARAYFVGHGGGRPYAGAAFETIGHSWRLDATVNTITPSDLLALGCLSTPLKKYTAADLLEPSFQAQASALLARIPADAAIADDHAAILLADKSPASELYRLIRTVSGMGKTRTSKLLARKRPGLIPIRDTNVEKALDASRSDDWWLPYHAMITTPKAATPFELAVRIHEMLGISAVVTPLRVIDAILWRSVESPDGEGQDAADVDE